MDYLRSRSYNSNKDFVDNPRCNKIMGISCGYDGPGDESSEWQYKTPFLKWKDACSSAGQVFIKDRYYDVSYLCCDAKGSDKYDGTCTAGCRRDEWQDKSCY